MVLLSIFIFIGNISSSRFVKLLDPALIIYSINTVRFFVVVVVSSYDMLIVLDKYLVLTYTPIDNCKQMREAAHRQ